MTLTDFTEHMPEPIRRRAVKRTFRPGDILIQKSEPASRVYLLVDGTTRVSNEFESGQRYTFSRNTAPQILGELEVLGHQPRYATTNEAMTPCTVYALPPTAFYDWMRSDCEFAIYVAELLASKMYPTASENGKIKFLPSTQRLEAYLLERLGGIETDLFVLHTSRQQIADDIGTSVKTVNRGVAKLKEEGLITLTHGKITLTRAQQQRIASDAGEEA